MNDVEKLLDRGVEEVIVREHLEKRLKSGEKLKVKFGIDPTAPDLHLGHTVPLRKLRQFQDAGHKAVLIIGDFTAMIGDPSGREGSRPPLTNNEVKKNMKKYLKQAGKVINLRKAEIKYNSKWFSKDPELIYKLSAKVSVQRVLERDDFQKRINAGQEISVLEELYPLLQGYDSVMVDADVEVGGTDQKFNMLMGRRLQRAFNKDEQDVVTLPLLEGTDGEKKMSKSYDNYIALDAEPNDMFGKIMRIPDSLIDKYYTLLTSEQRFVDDPREAKLELGRILVSMYHGDKVGDSAKEEFIKVFSQHGKPTDIKTVKLEKKHWGLADLLVKTDLVSSKSEARRLIEQGAVRINDIKKTDLDEEIIIEGEILVQVGKRKFLKIAE